MTIISNKFYVIKIQESKFKSKIKDNILMGPEFPIHRESVNLAETIQKTLKSKHDHIGQVYFSV